MTFMPTLDLNSGPGRLPVLSPNEMMEVDRQTIEDYGLSSLVLMENAARGCLQYVPDGRVLVLVGPGNNGGDGLVLARALKEQGRQVDVLMMSSKLSPDAQTQLKLVKKWGIPCHDYYDNSERPLLDASTLHREVIIDALFGTGLSRALTGRYANIVEMANHLPSQRISIDIPSGINGKNGQVMGTAFRAHQTVTFGCLKRGHLLTPGREHCGLLHLTQPGFHPDSAAQFKKVQLYTNQWAKELLPENWGTMHKGDNGRLLLVTGSKIYPGAGVLTALGALSAGAGLVSQSTEPEQVGPLLHHAPEAMPIPRSELPELDKFNALVVGSGLGPDATTLGAEVIRRCESPCVIDADCLDLVKELADHLPKETVLTPHPGELSRITGKSVTELEQDRIESARQAAAEFNCVVCFKGSPTITAAPNGDVFINSTGNPVLAQGGTGDLLAGIIGAYLAFGIPTFWATASAAFVHGLAADLAAESVLNLSKVPVPCSVRGLTSHRIAELVPIAYAKAVGNQTSFPVF